MVCWRKICLGTGHHFHHEGYVGFWSLFWSCLPICLRNSKCRLVLSCGLVWVIQTVLVLWFCRHRVNQKLICDPAVLWCYSRTSGLGNPLLRGVELSLVSSFLTEIFCRRKLICVSGRSFQKGYFKKCISTVASLHGWCWFEIFIVTFLQFTAAGGICVC